MVVGLIQ